MAGPFKPKFVDLVRNFTSTTGTGNIALGAAVAGHTSLAQAVAVGERFFYCIMGIDRPAEREVGRGTMAANGTIAREPIGGAPTNFSSGTKTIALVVAADWFEDVAGWINGGSDSLAALATSDKSNLVAAVNEVAAAASAGGGGGGSVGSTVTFATAAGAAIPAATLAVETAGHSSVGKGAARYIYDAAVNAGFVTANPRTAFVASGGRGFRLDPEQRLTIEMFGGKADYVGPGNTGTDNYAAFMSALQFRPVAGIDYTPAIHAGVGAYYSSATIEPQAVFLLRGEGIGFVNGGAAGFGATRIVTPTNTVCLRVSNGSIGEAFAGGGKNAAGSIIEGIRFEQVTQGNDLTAHGVRARGTPNLINCSFYNIAGDAIHIRANAGAADSSNGNCNDWRITNCDVHSCGNNGLRVDGGDANAGVAIGFTTHVGVGLCGIYDTASFVNTYLGSQITG
ncbi:MAG: hypothetical protein ABR588_06175, partial [Sphingomicrobium sp.]